MASQRYLKLPQLVSCAVGLRFECGHEHSCILTQVGHPDRRAVHMLSRLKSKLYGPEYDNAVVGIVADGMEWVSRGRGNKPGTGRA